MMKHWRCFETITLCLIVLFSLYLLVEPLIEMTYAAIELDTTAPVIAHEPVNIGKRGKSFNVIANIGDNNRIKRTIIRIKYGGKAVEGDFPVMEKEESVPVLAVVESDSVRVFSETNDRSRILHTLARGRRVSVTRSRENFYRITNQDGLKGYIKKSLVSVIINGYRYGATLPENITTYPYIFYQIRALDEFGNLAETKFIEVRFLTEDEIAELRGEQRQLKTFSRTRGTPFYKKLWFWLTMAATAGGTYYFINKDKQKKDANVTISVQWY